MRFTSHLDLQRTMERTIRRAGLPLSYSQGFNPHPKLIIAAALPLGITSECELLEIWLDNEISANEIILSLRDSVPPGIEIHKAESIDLNSPKLPNRVKAVIYEVTFLEPIPELKIQVYNTLSTSSLIRERRGKTYDLRPLINDIEEIPENQQGLQRIRLSLKNSPGETGRPDEVLFALNINPNYALIHRTEIILKTIKL